MPSGQVTCFTVDPSVDQPAIDFVPGRLEAVSLGFVPGRLEAVRFRVCPR
jgi:hypothetical protein